MTYSIWTHKITHIIQVWHTLFVSHLIVTVVLCGLGLYALLSGSQTGGSKATAMQERCVTGDVLLRS